ncbi:MAG: GGDEF and EAL domain-containing protein [Gammaproteobacteria bacterium]|nr:GGDEF and EAL domain-containing protein [Gammaproteobacteria bacterium]
MKQPQSSASKALDILTGLPDRNSFHATLEQACGQKNGKPQSFGLILIDIDRFKIVNYGYGEQYGDRMLVWFASLLREFFRPADILARWSGQEFICLLPHTSKDSAEGMAEQLRELMGKSKVMFDEIEFSATASFGVACYPEDGKNIDQLLSACGGALHQAKITGRDRVITASNSQPKLFGIGRMIDQALRDDRVVPAFQPIIDLKTGNVVAEEALARIVSPSGKLIPASAFIDAASELQLTHRIDRTILMQTFSHCVASLQRNQPLAHFVNISGNLLRHPDVVADLLGEARRNCVACGDLIGPVKPLVIEVTERELLADMATARNMLKPFLDFGLRLALDDFGSGYSSYHYLADLPFSFLKIEGQLIQRATEPRVRTILRGIQNTAAELGIVTLAEFVETAEIAAIVTDIGIDWAQGYYYGVPVVPGHEKKS